MKKNYWLLTLLAMLLTASLFINGCGEPASPSTEAPTESETESVPETKPAPPELEWQSHNAKPQDLRRKYDYADFNGVRYEFEEKKYTAEERNGYISELDAFLKLASETLGVKIPENLSIFVENSLDPYSEVGKVHANTEDFGTTHFFAQVVLGLTGEKDVNYAEAYAIADYVATKTEVSFYQPKTETPDEVKTFFADSDALFYLDFTLPLFETRYFTEENAGFVRRAATSFYRQLIEKEGIEKTVARLTQNVEETAPDDLVAAKNAWLSECGVALKYEPYFIKQYRHTFANRVKYPYEFTAYLTFWHFQVEDVEKETYKGMVEGYKDLIVNMGHDFDSAIAWFQEYLDGEINPVDVFTEFYTDNKEAENAGAVYINTSKEIRLYHDWQEGKYSLLHEYCHYLTIGCNMNDLSIVLYEGMAEYLSEIVCENKMAREFYVWYYGDQLKDLPELLNEDGSFKLDVYHVYQAWKYYIGKNDGKQYMQITGMMNPGRKTSDTILPSELSYADATGFTYWLFTTYGKNEVLTHASSFDELTEFTGKDFRTMFKEYGEWIAAQLKELAPTLMQ